MKAVLISIQPKWCELIASGKKTVEVRKTKPKLETPFKCYIYCTKSKDVLMSVNGKAQKLNTLVLDLTRENDIYDLNGKVIGEFVCDKIQEITYTQIYNFGRYKDVCEAETRLDFYALDDYLKQKNGYGWHISDLVIYDEPRELGEFNTLDNEAVHKCNNRYQSYYDGYCNSGCLKCGFYCSKKDDWCDKCKTKPLTRPPQSWCYVEELTQ
jgi:predicted transcriptional regulator